MPASPHRAINWDSDFLNRSAMFEPLKFVGEYLKTTAWPTFDDLMQLLQLVDNPITSKSGALIHFSAPKEKSNSFSEKYEPKIYLTGEVPTRLCNWHDLFNALVWLTFQKTKSALNEKHYFLLQQQQLNHQKNRGPLQDLLTLFDESGVIVVSSNPKLFELLKQARWKDLFWKNRNSVLSEMKFYLFGHALYEKALNPYRGMTGKCIFLSVENSFFVKSLKQEIQEIDVRLADFFSKKELPEMKQDFFPLPLLGVPGWARENELEIYYDDKSYFRQQQSANFENKTIAS